MELKKHYANYIIFETWISQRVGLKLEKPVDGRDCNYFFISSSLPSGSVTEGDSPHNELLLFFEQRPLPVFERAYFVLEKKHTISYENLIDSRHMFPERTQHLLPLELLVFHLTSCSILSSLPAISMATQSSFLPTSKFGPVSLCQIETERSFYL